MKRTTLLKQICKPSDPMFDFISLVAKSAETPAELELELLGVKNKISAYMDRLVCLRLDNFKNFTD